MEKRKSGFRIGQDDEGLSSYIRTGKDKVQSKMENRRLDKVERRITWMTFLILCLMCVIFFAGYLDMKKRFEQVQNSGITEVQAFSKDWEAKLSALSDQYNKIEKTLTEKENPFSEAFMAFEETTNSLKEELEKVGESIEQINEIKADKEAIDTSGKALADEIKKLSDEIVKINESLAGMASVKEEFETLKSDIQAAREEFKSFDEKLAKGLTDIDHKPDGASQEELAYLSKEMKQVKKDIVAVLADTIDRKILNAAIRKHERKYKNELNVLIKSLADKDDSIRYLQRKVDNLETRIKNLSRKQLGTPKPGTVLEEDLY